MTGGANIFSTKVAPNFFTNRAGEASLSRRSCRRKHSTRAVIAISTKESAFYRNPFFMPVSNQVRTFFMHSFKVACALALFMTGSVLVAQQPSPTQDPQSDTSLSSTPTPQTTTGTPGAPRAANPNNQAKHLAKELGLSRDQIAQIRPILADRDQQVMQLRSDTSILPRDRRAKMEAIQQDSTMKIEALLTDTQKQQYEQMLAERRNHNNRAPKA